MDIVQIKYGYICCLSIVHMFGIRTSPMPTLYPPIIWAYPYFICPLSVHAHLISARHLYIQGSPKECFPGLVNFVTAVAYHFCLNFPATFSQPANASFGFCTPLLKHDSLQTHVVQFALMGVRGSMGGGWKDPVAHGLCCLLDWQSL